MLVFGLTLRILRDRAAAEEATVDVYTQVWKQTGRYDPAKGTVLAWLLILVLGFNLFEVFVRLHGKLWQRGKIALQALAMRLDRGLEHPEELMPLWSG